ncbi:lysozyme inhibitor LprI family protein [Pseudomonas aeruginosa]|nr:lysozyme inhibitor LprI family protein [Pseudomonas aeruginosa]
MKHLAFLALGGLLLAPQPKRPASIAKKAERADEKAICANRALNDKDVEMSVKYHFLRGLFAMGGRGAMQDRQQDWLRERRRCGGDTDCLSRAYTQRIDELDKQYAGIDKPL